MQNNISTLLTKAAGQLKSVSTTSRLDAEILLSKVLEVPSSYFYTHSEDLLTKTQHEIYLSFLKRRLNHEPIAYILEQQEFWSLPLKITKDVLIPRKETELLVEIVLKHLPKHESLKICDLGTGSGAIALALASERDNWHIFATDLSVASLKIAQENMNILKNQLKGKVDFYHGSWCNALPDDKYDAIISNPPYIDYEDLNITESVKKFEPNLALFAKGNGLSEILKIIVQSKKKLKRGGQLFLEHGFQQGKEVVALLKAHDYIDVEDYLDLAGHSRVTRGKFTNI